MQKYGVLLKPLTTDTPTTNPPTKRTLTTYPPTKQMTIIKIVKAEEQIQNMFFTLQCLKTHNHLFPIITK